MHRWRASFRKLSLVLVLIAVIAGLAAIGLERTGAGAQTGDGNSFAQAQTPDGNSGKPEVPYPYQIYPTVRNGPTGNLLYG